MNEGQTTSWGAVSLVFTCYHVEQTRILPLKAVLGPQATGMTEQ